jgi:hypothetical protein
MVNYITRGQSRFISDTYRTNIPLWLPYYAVANIFVCLLIILLYNHRWYLLCLYFSKIKVYNCSHFNANVLCVKNKDDNFQQTCTIYHSYKNTVFLLYFSPHHVTVLKILHLVTSYVLWPCFICVFNLLFKKLYFINFLSDFIIVLVHDEGLNLEHKCCLVYCCL